MSTTVEPHDTPVRVRALSREADGVLAVELEPLGAPLPEWEPGAHVDVVLPGAPVRQYSLTVSPRPDRYRIAVLREPHSRGGSIAVHERLRPGDVIALRGPRNHFRLEPAAHYLFLAAGIGITPILPMVLAAVARGIPWRLVYTGAARERMAFLDEVAALAAAGGDVLVAARDEAPRVDLAAELGALPAAVVYACGPQRLLAELQELTAAEPERLRVEYFEAPALADGPGGTFSVRLARTGIERDVAPDQTILDVLRAAGVDVLSDCEEGICGSCETRVLDGDVEHRDVVLTAQEKARNDCLMVCVSRAACPLLVLDV